MAKHGKTRTPEWNAWRKMRERCSNPNSSAYPNYGGRGIRVCERWNEFINFYEDLGKRPTNHSLDRIDTNGDYTPKNCKWSTSKQQALNTRKSHSKQTLYDIINKYELQNMSAEDVAKEHKVSPSFVLGLVQGQKLSGILPSSLSFKEVSLVPQKNVCSSRLDTDIKSEVIRGVVLDIPLIATCMSTVTNSKFCTILSKHGSMGILHRAASPDFLESEVKEISRECSWVAASIGVADTDTGLADRLIRAGANILAVDVANAYADYVINFSRALKIRYPHIKLIMGTTTSL